jgi:hypothetical protein
VVSGDVRDGLEVISGLQPAAKPEKSNFFSFLRPPRSGSRP